MGKLTKVQKQALEWLNLRPKDYRAWTSHRIDPPIDVLEDLVDNGLAACLHRTGWFSQFRITDSGRAALSQGEKP